MRTISERALRNAIASTEMEGYQVTPKLERECRRLLSGEVTVEDIVLEILKRGSDERKGD